MSVEIFCCYAREDQLFLKPLKDHLMPFVKAGLITIWSDTDINAGKDWEEEINKHLNTAHIILLLVSRDFMSSDYCYSKEMKRALERHKHEEAIVIPIILRAVRWQKTPLGELQALPKDGKPVKSWQDEDDAYLDITIGLEKVFAEIMERSAVKSLSVTQVELKQEQNTPLTPVQQGNAMRILSSEQIEMTKQSPQFHAPSPALNQSLDKAAIADKVPATAPISEQPITPGLLSAPLPSNSASSIEELPDWLTGIMKVNDKTQSAIKQLPQPAQPDVPLVMNRSAIAPPPPPTYSTTSPASRTRVPPEPVFMPVKPTVKQSAKDTSAEVLLASTSNLPDNVRGQVVKSMQDIQRYVDHGLLTPATEECLKVIEIAPQYLDVHQVLCEIYVRQGKVEQAITKYSILINTYVFNGRIDDAISTYRRVLQLEPNNMTYRVRLINLLSTHGSKEELLRERTLAAESYLRLGYMDRALTELEQALQEVPTSVATRLNYALALQKLGRTQQAVAEYQRVLQVDPFNITALVRWHISMITGSDTSRATALEILSRIRWQLRGDGQKNYETVIREYNVAAETYPNNFDVRFAQGQIHQQASHFDLALDAYQFTIRDTSYEALARISSAQCLLAQGKPEVAIQQLEQVLQYVRSDGKGSVDPTMWAARPRESGEEHQAPEVEISLMLAKAYGRIGKQEQMQALLRQVKQATTHTDEVTSALAEISARQGDIDSALEEYADLVRSYRDKRQTDNALQVLREMTRLAPEDGRAHAELADIYIGRALFEESIAELRLLVDIYLRQNRLQDASGVLERLANIYTETGSTDDAFMCYRRAADLTPDNMDLLREVVSFCWQVGRIRESTVYQQIIARHYFDTHQVKESVAALQQLIALDRSNFDAYDMLGQTYQSVGEYEQASRVYKNLVKANPDSKIARERLADLQELRAKFT